MNKTPSDPAFSHRANLGLWELLDMGLAPALVADTRLGVRPPAQQTPAHLQGRQLGQAFGRWLRMRDDPGHAPAKARLLAAIAEIVAIDAAAVARSQARLAFGADWNHGLWASSACSMAALMGLVCADLSAQQRLLAELRAIARALAPAADSGQLKAADAACHNLMTQLTRPLGLADEDEAANRLALVWQSYEAGAALIGQGLVALVQDPAKRVPGQVATWLPRLQGQPGVVLNTRRFARVAMRIGEIDLQPGDGLLIPLTGDTPDGKALGFGHGPHACPGRQLALDVAVVALEFALEQVLAVEPQAWPGEWSWRILPNMRIPVFPEAG